MRRTTYEFVFAFLAWLIPFVMSVFTYHLKQTRQSLFEAIMSLTLVGTTVVLGCRYLRRRTARWVMWGLWIGCLWMISNWFFDALMFSRGPMRMSLERYVTEIGPAYLVIPMITIGLGAVAASTAQSGPAATRQSPDPSRAV